MKRKNIIYLKQAVENGIIAFSLGAVIAGVWTYGIIIFLGIILKVLNFKLEKQT